jgi:hypothetical protein
VNNIWLPKPGFKKYSGNQFVEIALKWIAKADAQAGILDDVATVCVLKK